MNSTINSRNVVLRETPHRFDARKICLAVAASLALVAGGVSARAAAVDDGPTPHSNGLGAAVSDAAITTKVKAKYVGDDRLKGQHVKVTTTNGVVTLTGRVASADAKDAAEEVAKSVDGVKSVDNELTTRSDGDVHNAATATKKVGSDAWITTKVKTEILSDSISKGAKVHVHTQNGVVMLSGTLPNDDAIAHVRDEAGSIQGVKSVDTSHLKSAAAD